MTILDTHNSRMTHVSIQMKSYISYYKETQVKSQLSNQHAQTQTMHLGEFSLIYPGHKEIQRSSIRNTITIKFLNKYKCPALFSLSNCLYY